MYPVGTIKVVWAEKNPTYISSEMFGPNEISQAIDLGRKNGEFLIMQLVSGDKKNYQWKILPYGNYKQYIIGINFNRNTDSRFEGKNSEFSDKEINFLQFVRLLDVFLIGPFLIYVSTLKQLNPALRILLFVIGVGTIVYNGRNYIIKTK